MRRTWKQIPILLMLQAVVFAAYRQVLALPLWNPTDMEILYDAHRLHGQLGTFFSHLGTYFSQPLLQVIFLVESLRFGLDPRGYLIVNLVLHGLNAFLVYLLVNMLFHRERMALPASLLFALGAGHYGKPLLSVSGLEPLLLAFLYLLVLFSLIRNDFHHQGRLRSPWFVFALGLFVIAGLTKPASFSLLGCLLAYKFFFYKERGRRAVLSPDLLIMLTVGVLFYAAQRLWGYEEMPVRFASRPGTLTLTWGTLKTIFRYLNLLVFPLQVSDLIRSSNPLIQFLYEWRVPLRTFVSLAVVSYSFFGLLFGSRALRFFIAWTFITVIPFTGAGLRGEWLNIQYLYLVAVGFCVILAAGATGCSNLLSSHRFRRWIPYLGPLLFAVVALSVNDRLVDRARINAATPHTQTLERLLRDKIRDIGPAESAAAAGARNPSPPFADRGPFE